MAFEPEKGIVYKLADLEKSLIEPKLDKKSPYKVEDLEWMFHAFYTNEGIYEFNLNSTFYLINIPNSAYNLYIPQTDVAWTTASFNIYGTTRLAWMLMKINQIKDKQIFDPVRAGQPVKYLSMNIVTSILSAIALA